MKQKLAAIALFGAISFSYAAYADTPMQLLIVTPTRFSAAPDNAAVDISVITASDIEKSAAKTLPELLAMHAGIQVRSNDGTSDMAIDLRGFGMTGNQNTLVLLDGQPLNEIQLTSIRWSSIPLDSIARIEIMNGSGAVLYGGGATGGTINIITKHPETETQGDASVGFGSYSTRQGQFSLSGKSGRVGMRVAASALDSSNYRANNNVSQTNLEADLRSDMGHGEAILKFGADNQNLRYPGPRTVDPTIGLNELVSDPRGTSSPLDYGKHEGGHASLGTSQKFDFGQLAGEVSYRDTKQKAFYAAYGGNYLETDLSLLSFTPRAKIPFWFGGYGNETVFGVDLADWHYDSMRSTDPATLATPSAHIVATQSNRSLYAQNTTRLDEQTKLTLGARTQRVDYHAGDITNPAQYASGDQGRTVNAYELGLRHDLVQDLSLFVRVGRSFRIATVDEIFDRYGGPSFDSKVTILEPQTSQDSEVGFDYKREENTVRAAFFRMDLNNEIQYNAITFTNMNLAPTRRYGLEFSGSHDYSDALEVTAAYSYTVAKFREGVYGGINVSGNNIPLVPRQRLVVTSAWKITENDTLDANAAYVGKQTFDNDQANTFGANMPAYTTVDMKFSRKAGPWLLAAAVNNLFNKRYFTYAVASTSTSGRYNAYPMKERNFSLDATYNF